MSSPITSHEDGERAWRCALLADVHGNLPALESVLADVRSRQLDAAYHLGDLVGYAPWPDEVVALLAEEEIPGVAGNYDSTVAAGAPHCGCRAETPEQEALAHASYVWTRARVNAATIARLRALPFRIDVRPGGGHHSGPTLRLVHGAPTLNTLYWDASRSDEFARKMAESFTILDRGRTVATGPMGDLNDTLIQRHLSV